MRCAKILLPVFLALGLTCSAVSAKAERVGENVPHAGGNARAEAGKAQPPKDEAAKPAGSVKPVKYDQNSLRWLESIRKQNLPQQDLRYCPALDPASSFAMPEQPDMPEQPGMPEQPDDPATGLRPVPVNRNMGWQTDASGRQSLSSLRLYNCNLRGKLSANQPVASLEKLDLSYNLLSSLNLTSLSGLKELVAYQNRLTRISGLENLQQLESLTLAHNRITRIENLDKLARLKELDLSNNDITKIQGLEKLGKLVFLDISFNPITRLEGLEGLSELEVLRCGSSLLEISGLDKLKSLKWLDLSGNRIAKIQGLEKLVKLQALSLGYNDIVKIEGLEGLPNLQMLSLDRNVITSLEGLGKLKNLIYLAVEDNQLEKLEGLQDLAALEVLDLCGNRLASLEGLPKKLQRIYLRGNSIPLSELYHASQLLKSASWFYGTQRDVFGNKELKTGHVYDLTKEALIGGKETSFYVFRIVTDSPATLGVEYQQNGGRFTFLKAGEYQISMFNPVLLSQLPPSEHDYDKLGSHFFMYMENGAPARAVTGVISVKD